MHDATVDEGRIGRLRVGLLGPLSLEIDGATVEVPGARRRAVLALLAVSTPEPLSSGRLVDAVWPDDPPASGRAALQSHISRLRRHLEPFVDRLTNTSAGYRLRLDEHELDVTVFAALVRDARLHLDTDPTAACAVLHKAVSLWRGAPLAELADIEPLAGWARTMTEEWFGASDLLTAYALRCGDAFTAVRTATDAVAVDPLREASVMNLMRALAAEHRTADALRAAHTLRTRLRELTGLDPSPALTDLEREIAAGPPPRTVASTTPWPRAGALFGREAELAGLTPLMASNRLLTIVGPGGVGKTRLAIELAQRHSATYEVITLVEFAALTDPLAIPDVLARSLGVEAGAGYPLARCIFVLQHRSHLLVLDNCEHLLEAVRGLVTTLLDSCPELTVLATSRERLSVAHEQTSVLAPLPVPGASDAERIEAVPSVALFLKRARKVRTGFAPNAAQLAAVSRIVRTLDGLPLAVELAAGRVSSLGLEDLEARLDRALDLLGGAAVASHSRHRTLRAAVQWSYDLLTPEEQRLFRHLAVQPGGFDLATGETIGQALGGSEDPATIVAHLVDCSMIVADLDGAPRYRMLDTLRAFGLDRLATAGELDAAHTSLLRWSVALASDINSAYETENEPAADRRLRAELANLRAAWRLARNNGDLEAAAALAVDLFAHASWRELTELLGWSLELAEDPDLVDHPWEARVLGAAAVAAWSSAGDLERAQKYARRGLAAVHPGDERGRSLATWALADVHLFLGRYAEAGELAISAREGTRTMAEAYAQAAIAAAYSGDLERAHEMAMQASAHGPTLRAYVRYVDGELANLAGDFEVAKAAYRNAIKSAEAVGASFIVGIASVGLVTAQAADGDIADALASYRELLELWERTGAWTQQWTTLRNLAPLLDQLGDGASATALRAAADRAPEASSLAGAPRAPLEYPALAAGNRTAALALARDGITRAMQQLREVEHNRPT